MHVRLADRRPVGWSSSLSPPLALLLLPKEQPKQQWTLNSIECLPDVGRGNESSRGGFKSSVGAAAAAAPSAPARDNQITSMCVVWSGIFVARPTNMHQSYMDYDESASAHDGGCAELGGPELLPNGGDPSLYAQLEIYYIGSRL